MEVLVAFFRRCPCLGRLKSCCSHQIIGLCPQHPRSEAFLEGNSHRSTLGGSRAGLPGCCLNLPALNLYLIRLQQTVDDPVAIPAFTCRIWR